MTIVPTGGCPIFCAKLAGIARKRTSRAMDNRYVAVFDLETQGRLDSVHRQARKDQTRLLEVSCGSVLKIPRTLCEDPQSSAEALESAEMTTYWIDGQAGRNMEALIDALLEAELVVGYNSHSFDFEVLKKYTPRKEELWRCQARSLDIFANVREATTRWYKLDRLLQLNGLASKSASGLQAIEMWERGDRENLQYYCEQDVRLTAELALLPVLRLEDGQFLENCVFGAASALAGIAASDAIAVPPTAPPPSPLR